MNKIFCGVYFIISMFLVSCNGDVGLLYAADCSAVNKAKFTNSIFKSNGSDVLYNEGMIYKNDGSNKAPGSSFLDTIINQESDVLQAYGALNNTTGIFCVPDINGVGSGLVTYSLAKTPGKINVLGTFTMSNCSFSQVSGNTYKFHSTFVFTRNKNPNIEEQKYDQYVNNSGTVEFTCERK